MAASRRRRLSAAALAATLLGLAAPAAPGSAAPTTVPAASADSTARITLTEVTPVIDGTSGRATIRGRLTNPGRTPIRRPTVTVVPATTDLSRAGIATWSEGTTPQAGEALDSHRLRDDLRPGESETFELTVTGDTVLPGSAWGVTPISVQTTGTAVHTFVGIHRTKEYVPLQLVWGVPVTLPASGALFGPPSTRRDRAWSSAVGPSSPLARLTSSPPARGDLWLLDPVLLDDGAGDGSALDGVSERERELRTGRATALRDVLDPSRTALLPEADADVAAAAGSTPARQLVRPRLEDAQQLAQEEGARADIAWPADGLLADDRLSALSALYGAQPTVLAPSTAIGEREVTPDAAQTTTEGVPLLLTDPTLSALAGGLDTRADAVLATQRLVAETASIVNEAPGTERTVVVLPDRSAQPAAAPFELLRESLADIPWAAPGTLPTAAASLAPVDVPDTVAEATATRAAGGAEPPGPLLTRERSQRLLSDDRARRSFAAVRADGPTWGPAVAASQEQLTSARWRSARWHFQQIDARLHRDVTLTRRDLTVASGDVNFFADTGRLQITVENHTDVELQHLAVRLTPQTHILRIDQQPAPITIGPRSRHTVTVQATALASGRVPVIVDVTDPDGNAISTPATLRARVSPTGNWIYWGIGGIAAALLAFGTWRTVRRPTSTGKDRTA